MNDGNALLDPLTLGDVEPEGCLVRRRVDVFLRHVGSQPDLHQPRLEVDGNGRPISHGPAQVVDVDVVTEHVPGVAVLERDRRAGEGDQRRVGLTTAVKVKQAAADAGVRIAKVTPLKGGVYEDGISDVMGAIAVGLGDEFLDTGHLTGVISRCKKGDGVLTIAGGPARLVLEMTDSERKDWGDYLDEAERNRQAVASLGLVPTPEQNAGHSIRVLGPRRIVMAFDHQTDDPALLRTVIQLLRVSALAAVARPDTSGAQVAGERIAEALEVLPKVEKIRKAAGYIRKNAGDIDVEADRLQTSLNRLLLQAQTALAGVPLSSVEMPGSASSTGAA